jgi:hypothetical protein
LTNLPSLISKLKVVKSTYGRKKKNISGPITTHGITHIPSFGTRISIILAVFKQAIDSNSPYYFILSCLVDMEFPLRSNTEGTEFSRCFDNQREIEASPP